MTNRLHDEVQAALDALGDAAHGDKANWGEVLHKTWAAIDQLVDEETKTYRGTAESYRHQNDALVQEASSLRKELLRAHENAEAAVSLIDGALELLRGR